MTELGILLTLKIQLDNTDSVVLLPKLAVKFIKQVKNLTSKMFINYKTSTKLSFKKLMIPTPKKRICTQSGDRVK
jgi:hypothetical protein